MVVKQYHRFKLTTVEAAEVCAQAAKGLKGAVTTYTTPLLSRELHHIHVTATAANVQITFAFTMATAEDLDLVAIAEWVPYCDTTPTHHDVLTLLELDGLLTLCIGIATAGYSNRILKGNLYQKKRLWQQ